MVQTKAEDVAVVWPQLVSKYPTPSALSNAKNASLARLVRPLGLQVSEGEIPRGDREISLSKFQRRHSQVGLAELLSIPHVGLYTATAMGCFAFDERVPIVDANILRVLGRIHGIKFGPDLRRAREAWVLAWATLPKTNPGLHNYGLLDFAAQVCTVKRPKCESCPLSKACRFGRVLCRARSNWSFAMSEGK